MHSDAAAGNQWYDQNGVINVQRAEASIEISNAEGVIIYQGKLTARTTLPMHTVSPGVYMLKLNNGANTETRKIVKE